ncbi:MAG: hypothetical protein LBS45_05285 [Synergistaceae bacterium]|jgi:hypothetical protein|nr:hypothetical protein [Synergistaceae bacterium]
MGHDWHDAGEENRDAAVASLREQIAKARTHPEGLMIREAKEAVPPGKIGAIGNINIADLQLLLHSSI